MTKTITGHFDGKVIVPDKPLKLPVGKRLRIQIEAAPKSNGRKNGKAPKAKPPKPLKFTGAGMFDSGIPDLATNKKYMEGFGKS